MRAEILLSLVELYEDILTRNQYKRFSFQGGDKYLAQRVLAGLKCHQIVMESGPCAVRLTDIGYKLIRDELPQLHPQAVTGGTRFPEKDLLTPRPPNSEEIRRVYEEMGRVDFISTSRIIDGRFVTGWASPGFEEVTGYTVQELEEAGGWPVLVRDLLIQDGDRQTIADLIACVLAGEEYVAKFASGRKRGLFDGFNTRRCLAGIRLVHV